MYKSQIIRLPLQYFAEGDGAAQDGGKGAEGTNTTVSGNEPPAQPSFDDMLKANKELQSEFDKRMAKAQETALANARAEWEKQAQAEKDEAARLAKMSADEKARHEQEKREKALADREAAVAKREMTAEAISQLTEKGLPAELSKCLDYSNAENCKASMEAVITAFSAAVEKQVNDKLRGTPPKTGAGKNEPEINSIFGALTYEHNNGGI